MSGLRFSLLSEEELQKLLDWHPTGSPLKAVSDYDVKFVQRFLYYNLVDRWLSDEEKDWHCPLLVTLRENKANNNWRQRAPDNLEETGKKKRARSRKVEGTSISLRQRHTTEASQRLLAAVGACWATSAASDARIYALSASPILF